jgi:hypothetical protein
MKMHYIHPIDCQATDYFFTKIPPIFLIIIELQTTSKVNKIINMFLDNLAKHTDTSASRRRAAVLAPPSVEPNKACYSELVITDK